MRSFIVIAALFAAVTFNSAFAQETSKKEAVRIEMDQEAKVFVFIIDDEPVAMLDKTGLHVPGEISYGLWITDTGPEHIKKKIAKKATEVADE